jgi:hypothetical protein
VKLTEWVAKEVQRLRTNKTTVLTVLARKARVSLMVLQGVERGARMGQYAKAKAVSEATGGKVTIKELCES